MMLKVLDWPLIISPSDQFTAANVVLVVKFQFLCIFFLLKSRLKIVSFFVVLADFTQNKTTTTTKKLKLNKGQRTPTPTLCWHFHWRPLFYLLIINQCGGWYVIKVQCERVKLLGVDGLLALPRAHFPRLIMRGIITKSFLIRYAVKVVFFFLFIISCIWLFRQPIKSWEPLIKGN